MTTPQDSAAPERAAPFPHGRTRPRRWPSVLILALLVLGWGTAMLYRWELRSWWWAWQVTRAEAREQRDYYVACLASIGDRALVAVPVLLDDARPEVREAAATILRFCTSPRSAEYLLAVLDDADADVAALAATTLAQRPDRDQHVIRLSESLSRSRGDTRSWGTAVALGRIGGPEAQAALLEALAQPCAPDVKAQLIDSLGLLGCREAIPLIEEAQGDPRPIGILPFAQRSAQRAVAALRGDLLARGTDPEQAIRAASSELTVAGVAAYWLRLLRGDPLDAASQPASAPP